ncbi:uncharacterized protein LOC119272176 [Triticum dicoccoides]|uniref:uncharacterized protein LOC119272176 n=1 Tax=Triticum dicoccoides TaxID=85692 RepID=UPI00188E0DC4|nr:uncharacterized protein LOC119272176 [Triticum dicoccoides]
MPPRENATPNSAAIVLSKLDQGFPPEHVRKAPRPSPHALSTAAPNLRHLAAHPLHLALRRPRQIRVALLHSPLHLARRRPRRIRATHAATGQPPQPRSEPGSGPTPAHGASPPLRSSQTHAPTRRRDCGSPDPRVPAWWRPSVHARRPISSAQRRAAQPPAGAGRTALAPDSAFLSPGEQPRAAPVAGERKRRPAAADVARALLGGARRRRRREGWWGCDLRRLGFRARAAPRGSGTGPGLAAVHLSNLLSPAVDALNHGPSRVRCRR